MKLFFADIDVSADVLNGDLPHIIGWLFIVLLLLLIWYYGKKAFGIKPPLDDQLKQIVSMLRSEIHREKNSALKEFKLKLAPVEARVKKSEQDIEDIQLDRQRKWENLSGKISDIANDVSYLRGIRKGESI